MRRRSVLLVLVALMVVMVLLVIVVPMVLMVNMVLTLMAARVRKGLARQRHLLVSENSLLCRPRAIAFR